MPAVIPQYWCDMCDHSCTAKPAIVHHYWDAHQVRCDMKSLRRAATRPPADPVARAALARKAARAALDRQERRRARATETPPQLLTVRERASRTARNPLLVRPTPQAPTCTLPGVWVPSGVRAPIDVDAARARAFAEADPEILDLDFSISEAC